MCSFWGERTPQTISIAVDHVVSLTSLFFLFPFLFPFFWISYLCLGLNNNFLTLLPILFIVNMTVDPWSRTVISSPLLLFHKKEIYNRTSFNFFVLSKKSFYMETSFRTLSKEPFCVYQSRDAWSSPTMPSHRCIFQVYLKSTGLKQGARVEIKRTTLLKSLQGDSINRGAKIFLICEA